MTAISSSSDAVALEQAELRDERLARSQDVARAQAGLRQQVADRRLVEAGLVVLDTVVLDPVLGEQRGELAARRAARDLVDGQAGHPSPVTCATPTRSCA